MDKEKQPIGYTCPTGWGANKQRGYVELFPSNDGKTTVQLIVDQEARTIHINGFWKKSSVDASNAMTFHF